MPLASDGPQYPSHASPQRYTRGPQTGVDGSFAGPPPGANPLPTALGGNIDLAGALEGSITDLRAASNELYQATSNINIMAQRINRMLGENGAPGSGIGGGAPAPNNVPSINFNQGTDAQTAGILGYAMARSYGSSMAAAPQSAAPYVDTPISPGASTAFAPFRTSASIPTNAGVPAVAPVAAAIPTNSVPGAATPGRSASWVQSILSGAVGGKEAEGNGTLQPKTNRSQAEIDQAEIDAIQGGKGKWDHGPASLDTAHRFAAHMRVGKNPTLQGIANVAQDYFPRLNPRKVPSTRSMTADEAAATWDLTSFSPTEREAFIKQGVKIAPKGIAAGAEALATGEGLGGAASALVGSAALDAAGPIGLALGAAKFGIHTAESQRSANMAYQSVEGGSNSHAFLERGRAGLFGLSQIGIMGMGQANQLFQGVTDIGLQGGNRQNALDFATNQYKNLGMSISDSLKLISISAKSGHANLSQLSNVLDSVTQSAAAASVNTEVARQHFTKLFQQNIANGLSTSGAATLAGASTNMSSSFGIAGQGVSFGTASPAALAAASGQSLGAFEYAQMTGGAQVTANAQQQWVNNMMSGIGNGIPNLKHLAAQQANSNGSNTAFSKALLGSGSFSVEEAKAMLNAANVSFDPNASNNTIMTVLAGTLSGKANISTATRVNTAQQAIAAAAKKQHAHPGLKNQIYSGANSWMDPAAWVSNTITDVVGGKGAMKSGAADLGLYNRTYTDSAKTNLDRYITAHGGAAGTDILSGLFTQGQKGHISLGGKNYDINQALSNSSLMNQIAAGKGQFFNAKGQKESYSKLDGHPQGGTSNNKNNKNSGTVTIAPTPQLAQFLSFATSGSATMSSSALQFPPSQSPAYLPNGN